MPRIKNRTTLQYLRERRKLSIDGLARLADCDPSQISYWERHVREPSREMRAAYARALKVSVGELGRLIYEGSVSA